MLCLFCAYYSTDRTVNATIQRFTITLRSKAEFLWRAKAERILLFPHLISPITDLGIVAEKDDWSYAVLRLLQHS